MSLAPRRNAMALNLALRAAPTSNSSRPLLRAAAHNRIASAEPSHDGYIQRHRERPLKISNPWWSSAQPAVFTSSVFQPPAAADVGCRIIRTR